MTSNCMGRKLRRKNVKYGVERPVFPYLFVMSAFLRSAVCSFNFSSSYTVRKRDRTKMLVNVLRIILLITKKSIQGRGERSYHLSVLCVTFTLKEQEKFIFCAIYSKLL